MKSQTLMTWIGLVVFLGIVAMAHAEDAAGEVYVSPSGAWRIMIKGTEVSLVSTSNPSRRAVLPKESEDAPPADEFHMSPNDEWIFAMRHEDSGLNDNRLYHLVKPLKVERVDTPKSFNTLAWAQEAALNDLGQNILTNKANWKFEFRGWSLDSGRLLVRLDLAGDDKKPLSAGYLYFNTQAKNFEVTDYLRQLNKVEEKPTACAEPIAALPQEQILKVRFESLDKELNEVYRAEIKDLGKKGTADFRESQRAWIQDRDQGLQLYLASTPPAEAASRKLQFLGDLSRVRIEEWKFPLGVIIREESPDHRFAARYKYSKGAMEGMPEKIDIVTHSNGKLVSEVDTFDDDNSNNYRGVHITWAPDSRRFAYTVSSKRIVDTQVFALQGQTFVVLKMPNLEQFTPDPGPKEKVRKFNGSANRPARWPKDNTVVIHRLCSIVVEPEDGDENKVGILEGDYEILIRFDAKGQGKVEKVLKEKESREE